MRKMLLITSKPGKHRLWRVSKWWDYAQYVQYKESPEKKKIHTTTEQFLQDHKRRVSRFEREAQILGQLLSICHWKKIQKKNMTAQIKYFL